MHMQERHDNEQYFFDPPTVQVVADLLAPYARPCVLCAPTVGAELESRGVAVTVLDIDERFAHLHGFRHWDINRPQRFDERFDVIFCDPPFFNVSLSRLLRAIRTLAHFDDGHALAVTYLARRRDAFLSTFGVFSLRETHLPMEYGTVWKCEKNEISLFANFQGAT